MGIRLPVPCPHEQTVRVARLRCTGICADSTGSSEHAFGRDSDRSTPGRSDGRGKLADIGGSPVCSLAARVAAVIRIDEIWLAVDPLARRLRTSGASGDSANGNCTSLQLCRAGHQRARRSSGAEMSGRHNSPAPADHECAEAGACVWELWPTTGERVIVITTTAPTRRRSPAIPNAQS